MRICLHALAVMAASLALPLKAHSCGGTELSAGVVAEIGEAGTLLLRDGRRIRLAGIELPDDPAARQQLAESLAEREVFLRGAATMPDRYGRVEAYVFAAGEGLDGPVQRVMLEKGLARVSARISDRACAAGFLSSESQARQARRGLWAEPRWAVLKAETPAAILAQRGAFALVEGRVLSVRESGGSIYVNFGRRWSEDFTVTVAKRHAAALAAGGLDVKRLDRHVVRVRGWIEERGGPWIEVTRPEQIELIRN